MKEEPIRILMVDDRPENLVSLGAILDSPDYRLLGVESGEEALRALLKDDFAVILMDVQMPGMDGFETAALIKQRVKTKHVPIIFITANSQEEKFIYRGYSTGAVDYILKPVSPEILRSKVAVFADLHRKTRQLLKQKDLERENERLERERAIARLELENSRRERISQQRYRDLLSGLHHAIVWSADPVSLVPTFVSDLAPKILGYDPKTRMIGQAGSFGPNVPKADRENLLAAMRRTVETGQEELIEHRLLTAEGRELWFQTALRLGERSDRPGENEIRGLSFNVTPIKAAEQAAIESLRAREEFLSVASHELKTPLTSLKLQLQGVRRVVLKTPEKIADKVPALTERCENQVDRLARLVDDLLDVTRIRAGKLEVAAEDFDLVDLLREVVARLSLDLVAAKCELTVNAIDSIKGSWDRLRIDQVLTNLLTNAFKYGPGKPIEITLLQDETDAVVQVRDHGVGIPKKDHDRIFARFERAAAHGTRGLGLGLYIAREIVQAHGGTIAVESELSQGSTFTVRLPLSVAPGLTSARLRARHSEPKPEGAVKSP